MESPQIAGEGLIAADAFAGEVAVVTGGGTGLGLEISRGLAARGADVTILSRNAEHHTALLDEAKQHGWRVHARSMDVREPKEVAAAAAEVRDDRDASTSW